MTTENEAYIEKLQAQKTLTEKEFARRILILNNAIARAQANPDITE